MKLLVLLTLLSSMQVFAQMSCNHDTKYAAMRAYRADYPEMMSSEGLTTKIDEMPYVGFSNVFRVTFMESNEQSDYVPVVTEYMVETQPTTGKSCKVTSTYEGTKVVELAKVLSVTCGEIDGFAMGDHCIVEAFIGFKAVPVAIVLDNSAANVKAMKDLKGKLVVLRLSAMDKVLDADIVNALKRKFPKSLLYQTVDLETALTIMR